MVSNDIQLSQAIDCIHETMKAAKQKLKNAALLRNLTDLKPKMHNKTRWSGKYAMLERWGTLRDDLIEAENHQDLVGLNVNSTIGFQTRVSGYTSYLREINEVTLFLQLRCLTLAEARMALDLLTNKVIQGRNMVGNTFYKCRFQAIKTAPNSILVPNPHFESGVVKIQHGQLLELSDAEKEAVEGLRTQELGGEDGGNGGNDDEHMQQPQSPDNIRKQLRRMKEARDQPAPSVYVNCDFIYGSAAEVEHLWSICSHILTDERKGMTPQLFEALVFLKQNHRFWDASTVAKAMSMAKGAMTQKQIEWDLQQIEVLNH
jgi:hypothetical protein